MDWSRPVAVVSPGLEGPILRALRSRRHELTAPQVHRIARAGTVEGVRRALDRPTRQGIVDRRRTTAGPAYSANTDHLCWAAVEALFDVLHPWCEMRRRVRALVADLGQHSPLGDRIAVAVVGSAARGDGDADDDLDLLVIVPDGLEQWLVDELSDRLRRDVRDWTGNAVDLHVRTPADLAAETRAERLAILERWALDAEQFVGPAVHDHLPLVVWP